MNIVVPDEAVVPLTPVEAKQLTESIRICVIDLEEKVVVAYFGRVWIAMGYPSWDDYIHGEFKSAPLALPREDRRVQVASLRQQGLSMPAIASVTGTSVGTVHSDLEPFNSERLPDRIVGTDGKVRPSSLPQVSQVEAEQQHDDTPRVAREACPTCGQSLPAHMRKDG